MTNRDVLIVGAGLAGLTAARRLQDEGMRSVVIDKGRAPGGRMATRRVGDARFDHGAQHFSARSPAFREQVESWMAQGLVREWYRSASITDPARGVEPRHSGVDGMRSIPEAMADGLDVRLSGVVEQLEPIDGGRVVARVGQERTKDFAAVILTPPVPQIRALLESSEISPPDHVETMLEGAAYDACLAVMAVLDRPSELPDGHRAVGHGPIAWLADNHHKGVSAVPAVTIHSTAEFAASRIDDDSSQWSEDLCRAAAAHLSSRITGATPHRWRYAQPRTTFDVGAVAFDCGFPVVLAGEIFSGAKVEGAFTSGMAAAAAVLDALS